MQTAGVATEVVKIAVGCRHGGGRRDAQVCSGESIGWRGVGSVSSVGLGGGGGVAESREWFGRGRGLVQHLRWTAGGRLGCWVVERGFW